MASSLVSIAFSSPVRTSLFIGVRAHDFVERGSSIAGTAQDATEALFGLSGGSRASNDNSDFDVWYIYAFIQHLVGNQRRIDAGTKAFQNFEPFAFATMI